MRRTWSFLFILLLIGLYPLAAQESDFDSDDEYPEIEWDTYVPDLYRTGDKVFSITAGITFPTVFSGKGMDGNPSNIKLGGMGRLIYSYFFSSHWFLGGELGGMFSGTGGKNMYFAVPFGVHFGYQFVIKRFEFPIYIMTGGAPQKYTEKDYFGWIIKPGISGFFRYDADWSFGLNVNWWMLPQWPKNGNNVLGNFLEISLTARYHF